VAIFFVRITRQWRDFSFYEGFKMPQYKWLVSDTDSCFACTRWNNKIFNKLTDVPDLPVHPHCRCRIQLIHSPQEKRLDEVGQELNRLKQQSDKDLYDLSTLILIPFLFERLVSAAKNLYSDVAQAIKTLDIFWENYWAMREADFIGSDTYFHSKSNAEAAQLGDTGEATAKFISDAREFIDYYKNIHLKKLSLEATIEDATKDQRANVFGREQGRNNPNADPRDLSEPLRPEGLDERY
jgi:serum amyloid A protein